jgi:hypothetical protein
MYEMSVDASWRDSMATAVALFAVATRLINTNAFNRTTLFSPDPFVNNPFKY